MYIPNNVGKRRTIVLFLLPSLIGVIGFCLLPILASAIFSVMDYEARQPFFG